MNYVCQSCKDCLHFSI
uniref:Uncharacterized protein n=1 Tax=Arundo donax TaxID=35708 RepID=A0A0A9AIA0_ARUDO